MLQMLNCLLQGQIWEKESVAMQLQLGSKDALQLVRKHKKKSCFDFENLILIQLLCAGITMNRYYNYKQVF